MALACLVWVEGNAQLLEDGQNKLKTIKTQSRGFLFFGRKIKSEDPGKFRQGRNEKIRIRRSTPVSYNRREVRTNVRTSTPASYNRREIKTNVRTTTPVSYNRKDIRTNVKNSKPVTYNRKEQRSNAKTSLPVSYSPKEQRSNNQRSTPVTYGTKERRSNNKTSIPVTYSAKERQTNVRYSLPPLYERHKKTDIRYTKWPKENFYDFYITRQLKAKRRPDPVADASSLYGKTKFSFIPIFGRKGIGPLPDAAGLYSKSRFSLKKPWVFRNKLSITGNMTYKYDQRLAQQFRPINTYTLSYKGDHKRQNPFLQNIRYRIGQWQRSSYKGHHVSWSKFGKQAHLKGSNNLMANYHGKLKVRVPFIDNIYKKMGNWEQTHYQGRSIGWSEFGKQAHLKGNSNQMSKYEGNYKIKRRKGGDMHPSIAYISGKRFHNNNWKERWRKLNILWVRVNPGKEVPDGPKVKVKVKYDKEERDLWTY